MTTPLFLTCIGRRTALLCFAWGGFCLGCTGATAEPSTGKSDAAASPAAAASPTAANSLAAAATPPAPAAETQPSVRKFRFTYAATVHGLAPQTKARIWIPVPQTTPEQTIAVEKISLPADHRVTREQQHGSGMFYLEAQADAAGEIPLAIEYLVERREVRIDKIEPQTLADPQPYLVAARFVPVDGTIRRQLLGEETPSGTPAEVARRLYDAVYERIEYGKPEGLPWGRGDATWACESGVGNCTDFHSAFIAAARDLALPTLFEIGFPIPQVKGSGEVGGYHCWAKFHDGQKWIPVDISEADKHPELKEYYFGNLTADRVTFTRERDLQLDPPQQAGPVNYFVYPHVEVDGRQHTGLRFSFRYQDVP